MDIRFFKHWDLRDYGVCRRNVVKSGFHTSVVNACLNNPLGCSSQKWAFIFFLDTPALHCHITIDVFKQWARNAHVTEKWLEFDFYLFIIHTFEHGCAKHAQVFC